MNDEIFQIKQQYHNNKAAVLKNLIDIICEVKLEVPDVIKANFISKSAEDWEEEGEVM